MSSTLPEITEFNQFFWTSGADGKLRILSCDACGFLLHPPGPICPKCLGKSLSPKELSGLATVEAVTVNHQAWTPGMEVPYAIARVSLAEDPSVRITTRIVGAAPEAVRIGQQVKVQFVLREDVYLPFFEPI